MLILLQRIMTSPLWQVKLLYCTKVKDYLGRLKLAWIFADFSTIWSVLHTLVIVLIAADGVEEQKIRKYAFCIQLLTLNLCNDFHPEWTVVLIPPLLVCYRSSVSQNAPYVLPQSQATALIYFVSRKGPVIKYS